MLKAQIIEHLPFFEDNFKGDVLPLGRISFTLKDSEINQLLYLYNNEIYITELTSSGCKHYKTVIQRVGAIFDEVHSIPVAADFYLFNIFAYISCTVKNGYSSKYLELEGYKGILLFENGNYDFIEYENKYKDNYMHINDLFEYKTSFNGLLHHIKEFIK